MGTLFGGEKHGKPVSNRPRFPEWDDVKYCFINDGCLLDIRVPNIEADDFPKFFNFLKSNMHSVEYLMEGREHALPSSFKEYQDNARERGATLSATFHSYRFNCHSFFDEYLELDFWPNSVTKRNFPEFLDLVRALGQALSQDLTISDECSSSPPFICYSYKTDALMQLPENFIHGKDCGAEELAELSQREG